MPGPQDGDWTPPEHMMPPDEWTKALGRHVYLASVAQFILLVPSSEEAVPPLYNVTVTTRRLRVRAGPGKQFAIVDHVLEGDVLWIFTIEGVWGRITAPGTEQRWIHTGYTERTEK